MMTCRHWLKALVVAGALAVATLLPASAREVVAFRGYAAGNVVIVTQARELYYVLGNGQAIRYPVGVGRAGMAWHGKASVAIKRTSPPWQASAGSPVIPGGSPQNPMGAAVLGLDHGNYAIHGTNDPASIGYSVSHGCIRMQIADVERLYDMVYVGTSLTIQA
jgi:lipoprotein-anchoring transpeptidase ErfK/SrfK